MDNSPGPTEAKIKADVLVALSRIDGVCVWNHPSGVAQFLNTNEMVSFGCVGSADIIGCAWGRAIAIETKTKRGTQQKQQKRFQQAWELAGGFYLIAREVEEAIRKVEGLRH